MSRQNRYPKYSVLGVMIDALTKDQAISFITDLAKKQDGASYVVKPYVEFLDRARREKEIADLLNDAELCLPDGIAAVWATHYLYGGRKNLLRLITSLARIVLRPASLRRPLPEVFRGVTFTWQLLRAAADENLSVFLVGSPKRGHIAGTASFIKGRLPNLKIVGHFTGRLNAELRGQLLRQLRASNPDIILVGMGFPLQEELMSWLAGKLDRGVMIGEGGSFDFKSMGGHLPRAPKAVRVVGLEWLWRVALEPWRLARQLAIWRVIWAVGRTK